ncbi:MAG: hypothetical protein CM15mP120_06700 [Pseudomonadota bacterium]|nr:MAG: hypothetical protein CM15mP120_06700 [Pseudomonadota bacterium]
MDNSIGVLVLFTCIGFVGLFVLLVSITMMFFDLHPMWGAIFSGGPTHELLRHQEPSAKP